MLVIAGNWVLWISQEASTHWLIWIEDSVFRNSSLKAVVHIPWLYVMTFQDDLDMGNLKEYNLQVFNFYISSSLKVIT